MYFRRISTLMMALCLVAASAAFAQASNLPDFTELAANSGKAVVNISTVKTIGGNNDQLKEFFRQHPKSGPFDEFFDQFERFFGNRNAKPHKQRSLGSGFIISKDGYIVTNNHVVDDADEVDIALQNSDDLIQAKIVGRDPETDLALLKIDVDHDLPFLEFGDSDAMQVGEWVVAIGNPFGLGHTVTAGIISAKGRIIGAGPFDDFLQTDASINPGNSGGPLINMKGKVIGINSAIVASGQGIGFAVPGSMANEIIEQLKSGKAIQRGWLGVSIQDVDEDMAKALGLPSTEGALIANVVPGDPAAEAGIKTSDVIISVNDEPVADANELLRAIAKLAPGEKIDVTVWRNGKKMTFRPVLGTRETTKTAEMTQPDTGEAAGELGLTIKPLDQEEAKALGMDKPEGLVVVEVKPDSPAGEADLRPGDVILEINQKAVESVDTFKKIVEEEGKDKGVVMLLIRRQGQNVFRTIQIK